MAAGGVLQLTWIEHAADDLQTQVPPLAAGAGMPAAGREMPDCAGQASCAEGGLHKKLSLPQQRQGSGIRLGWLQQRRYAALSGRRHHRAGMIRPALLDLRQSQRQQAPPGLWNSQFALWKT